MSGTHDLAELSQEFLERYDIIEDEARPGVRYNQYDW